MPLHTETLTTAWYQVDDLDDDEFVMLIVEGDDIDVAIDVVEPPGGSVTFTLVEGLHRLDIPSGKFLWLKCPTGTADATYSQFGGILMDTSKAAYAFNDNVADEGLITASEVILGFDDTGAETYEFIGFLHTVAANIDGAATIDQATLSLEFFNIYPGSLVTLYGVAESTSQFGTLADWADLESGLDLTTEFVEFTVGYTGRELVDITDLLQELVDLGGWNTASPIQLWFRYGSTAVVTVDTRSTIRVGSRLTAIFANVS